MVNTDYEVKILMTLTLNCPVAESLPREVEDKVKSIASVDAEVEITLIRLGKDLMSEEAKLEWECCKICFRFKV
jgi:metal-sulfur cluster biosynthetic enzyme